MVCSVTTGDGSIDLGEFFSPNGCHNAGCNVELKMSEKTENIDEKLGGFSAIVFGEKCTEEAY